MAWKKKALLILAAGYKSYDDSFKLNEPLLNIGNTLNIDRIKKNYNFKNKIYIAVNKFPETLKKLNSFSNCNFIDVGDTSSVIETIKLSITQIDENHIEILPITTIPENQLINNNSVYFGDKKISKENWSAIRYSFNKDLEYFFKKDKTSFKDKCYPFTGRISSSKKYINEACNKLNKKQMQDLLYLARLLIDDYGHNIIYEKWYDSGHSSTYFQTKISSFSSRFFNEVKYCTKKNTIIKKSKDNIKLKKEKKLLQKYSWSFKHIFSKIIWWK